MAFTCARAKHWEILRSRSSDTRSRRRQNHDFEHVYEEVTGGGRPRVVGDRVTRVAHTVSYQPDKATPIANLGAR